MGSVHSSCTYFRPPSLLSQIVFMPHGGPGRGGGERNIRGQRMPSAETEPKPHGGFRLNDIWMTRIKGIQHPIWVSGQRINRNLRGKMDALFAFTNQQTLTHTQINAHM